MTEYPVQRFIHTIMVDGEQPAYAPSQAADPLEAYASFLYETREAAEAALADELDDANEDTIHECTVHADGSIITPFHAFTRSYIFDAYAMTDENAPTPKL